MPCPTYPRPKPQFLCGSIASDANGFPHNCSLARHGIECALKGSPPPVLPVVVYNGKRAWTSPRSLGEMTAPVPGLPPPGEYVLVDMLRLAGEN